MTDERNSGLPYRHILVGVQTYAAYGRRIIDGILDYADRRRVWEFSANREGGLPQVLPPRIDGAIAEIRNDDQYARAQALNAPVVAITGVYRPGGLATVIADNPAVGRMGAEYLSSLGFEYLAYFGAGEHFYIDQRREGFVGRCRELGIEPHVFHPAAGESGLERWLADLPKPVAVMGAEDWSAVAVANACRELGIAVPEQVAILGVDNDEHLCRMANPPLSSIDHGARRIGFEGASLLEELMNGAAVPDFPLLVEPTEVIVRQSTDTLAISDPMVGRAVEYIRQNACNGLDVPDVVRQVRAARRTLEAAFRRTLGRTILQEINRVRVERAKDLLINTDMAMPEICERTGFSYPSRLSYVIKKDTGLSPRDFRRSKRV
ncbi:MAG: substrate-binding domain-containing protein [Phycisphaerae bacterium]